LNNEKETNFKNVERENTMHNELINILISAITLTQQHEDALDNTDELLSEFNRRTCAIEMNDELTDAQVDNLESIKLYITKLFKEV
jgi:hypothetical protein